MEEIRRSTAIFDIGIAAKPTYDAALPVAGGNCAD
jgi:hypothetical protein